MKTKIEVVSILLKLGWTYDEIKKVFKSDSFGSTYGVTCDMAEINSEGYTVYTIVGGPHKIG